MKANNKHLDIQDLSKNNEHGHSNNHNQDHGHDHGFQHNHGHDHDHGYEHEHNHEHCGCCGHNHNHHVGGCSALRSFIPEILSLVLLVTVVSINWENEWLRLFAYIVALLPVGIPILVNTVKEWMHADFFNEFTLMVLASVGAFFIGEYPEGVAVLLFYSLGEKLEDVVSGDVKGQIKKLLGKMPKTATLLKDNKRIAVSPQKIRPGDLIAVKAGEALPLDGKLMSDKDVDFNTAAITGESMPRTFKQGDQLNSGIIPLSREVIVEVTNSFDDSSLTRIIKMIDDASSHRAPSERVLRRITRWYTPIVFIAALLLFVVPWLVSVFSPDFGFEWNVWLRRSLVFLVCSCPCALIVSIPLTYFSSIGIASKKGILFKGHDALDTLGRVNTVLLDKTGTVTTGKFHVSKVSSFTNCNEEYVLALAAALEIESPHPLAEAIVNSVELNGQLKANDVQVVDHGMQGSVNGKRILVGSAKLMESENILLPKFEPDATVVFVAEDGKVIGSIFLEDTLKIGVKEAVNKLHDRNVTCIGILSGDTKAAVSKTAEEINADFYAAELMPGDKQIKINEIKESGNIVAFAGDGVNDGPALAAADVGIAMGNEGTDIAIESAQIVIAGDNIEKISEGIDISRRVKRVIIENVTFAFGVKLAVMILGAFGIASLWAAVFADTGVTVITILWTLYRLKIWQLRTRMRN